MYAKKSLGQNFLMHPQIAERIVRAAQVSPGDTVLEIGPGRGMLTRVLLAQVARVVAVEADAELVESLQETFAAEIATKHLVLIHGDIRTFDPATIGSAYSLVANIPYYITGEIIRMFLTTAAKPSSLTLLVQKEVAERIARSKKESLLSLAVKAYGVPQYCFLVPRGAFRPAPNVDSAVLHIAGVSGRAWKSAKEEQWFFEVLHAGFAHKRKLLRGNLETLASRESVEEAFRSVAIPEKARSEDISLASWISLAAYLSSRRHTAP